jgi:hypothetical protein
MRLITFNRFFHAVRTILAGLLIFFLWGESSVGAVIIGVLFFYLFPFLADLGGAIFSPEPMGYPVCPNGSCKNKEDYELTQGIQACATFKCKCGVEFLYFEKRFLRLDSDGIAHPYKVYKNRKVRWIDDTGEPIDTKTAVLRAWAKELEEARAKKKREEDGE